MNSPRDPDHEAGDDEQVTLGSLYLAPFDADAPTLTTPDGAVYIPIRWLCELLGLAPSHWIGVVCACYRGDTEADPDAQETQGVPEAPDAQEAQEAYATQHTQQARRAPAPLRRLPSARAAGAVRREWCLEWSRVVRWLSFHLDSRRVRDSLRHNQLRAFRKTTHAATSAIYERDQAAFEEIKRLLSAKAQETEQTLATLERLEPELGPHLEHSAATPAQGAADRVAFAALVAEGRTLHQELLDALRATLRQMADLPVVDAFRVDATGAVVDSLTMPIIPVTPDLSEVTRFAEAAANWRDHELIAWLRARGFIRPAAQREETPPDEPVEPAQGAEEE